MYIRTRKLLILKKIPFALDTKESYYLRAY